MLNFLFYILQCFFVFYLFILFTAIIKYGFIIDNIMYNVKKYQVSYGNINHGKYISFFFYKNAYLYSLLRKEQFVSIYKYDKLIKKIRWIEEWYDCNTPVKQFDIREY